MSPTQGSGRDGQGHGGQTPAVPEGPMERAARATGRGCKAPVRSCPAASGRRPGSCPGGAGAPLEGWWLLPRTADCLSRTAGSRLRAPSAPGSWSGSAALSAFRRRPWGVLLLDVAPRRAGGDSTNILLDPCPAWWVPGASLAHPGAGPQAGLSVSSHRLPCGVALSPVPLCGLCLPVQQCPSVSAYPCRSLSIALCLCCWLKEETPMIRR